MIGRSTRAVAVCALIGLLLTACGGDSEGGGSTSAPVDGSTDTDVGLPDVDQNFEPSGPLTASAPGVTEDTIKIGYVTSQTGLAASSFEGGDAGARARIELQNEQGGINGRQIELVAVDDGALGPLAAAQKLVEEDQVFGIIFVSAFTSAATPYMNEQGIPVTGGGFDGPQWGQQPNTNMFTYFPPIYTPFDGKFYLYDTNAQFLQSQGVTQLATIGYQISQASTQNLKSTLETAKPYGIEACYENYSVQFGATSFPTESLAIQNEGCDGLISAMVDSSDVGLSAALKQAGVSIPELYYTGYSQSVLDDPNSAAALDGAYFPASPNWSEPSRGVQQMLNAFAKYAPEIEGIPNLGVWQSYFAADLMIEGLEVAGENPTREDFITNMRQVTDYDGHGLFAESPLSFTDFGTVEMFPEQQCNDFVQLRDGEYVTVAKDVCGKLVETTG